MGVVGRGHHGHGASAACVGVAQFVGKVLKFICRELVLIMDHVVVCGARGAQQASMTLKVKVELDGVSDTRIHDHAGLTVARAVCVLWSDGEEASVVALLDNHERDLGGVAGLELSTSSAQGGDLVPHHFSELILGNAIAIEQDALWFFMGSTMV